VSALRCCSMLSTRRQAHPSTHARARAHVLEHCTRDQAPGQPPVWHMPMRTRWVPRGGSRTVKRSLEASSGPVGYCSKLMSGDSNGLMSCRVSRRSGFA